MQVRGIMIIVLVACLLLGWVRSQDGSASHRSRRPHLKRRVLERLAERGLSEDEQEAAAEEILARVASHLPRSSSPSTTPPPQHTHHHHNTANNHHSNLPPSLEMAASSLIDERPSFQDIKSQIGPFPDLEVMAELQEESEREMEEQYDDEEVSKEVTKAIMHQYLFTEVQLEELLRGKRDDLNPVPGEEGEAETTERSRRRKNRKNSRREDRERRQGNIKNQRRKNKKKKLNREVRRMIDGGDITLIEDSESGNRFIDCCPSKLEYINKTLGKTENNRAVELHPSTPYFIERICLPQFVDQECIFPARALRPSVVTRCAQQYSFSPALARLYRTNETYSIQFIQVRSGCSCQVAVNHKKKRRRKRKR